MRDRDSIVPCNDVVQPNANDARTRNGGQGSSNGYKSLQNSNDHDEIVLRFNRTDRRAENKQTAAVMSDFRLAWAENTHDPVTFWK